MTTRMELRTIGREGQVVAVVDGFAADPDALRALAATRRFGPARHAYPGVRAELPPDYWSDQRAAVAQAVEAILGCADDHRVIDASFSIVTTPRDRLTVAQRLPHGDAHEPGRIALVHYLMPDDEEDRNGDGDGEGGGTAFFRHRSTGWESVDADRAPIYGEQLDAELRYGGPPPADYVAGDDRLFERIAVVPARYNRAILYRGVALHSGVIPPAASLSAEPLDGRLTVTGFLATHSPPVRPPSA